MQDPAKLILGALRAIEDDGDEMHADIVLTAVEREIMAIRRRRRMMPGFIAQDGGHMLAHDALRRIEELAAMPVKPELKHAALMDVHQAVHAEIDNETDPDEPADRTLNEAY